MSSSTTPKLYISTLGPYAGIPFYFFPSNYSGAANLKVPTPVVKLLHLRSASY